MRIFIFLLTILCCFILEAYSLSEDFKAGFHYDADSREDAIDSIPYFLDLWQGNKDKSAFFGDLSASISLENKGWYFDFDLLSKTSSGIEKSYLENYFAAGIEKYAGRYGFSLSASSHFCSEIIYENRNLYSDYHLYADFSFEQNRQLQFFLNTSTGYYYDFDEKFSHIKGSETGGAVGFFLKSNDKSAQMKFSAGYRFFDLADYNYLFKSGIYSERNTFHQLSVATEGSMKFKITQFSLKAEHL